MPTSKKISALAALTGANAAGGDYVPIVDISEAAAADQNKRMTLTELASWLTSEGSATVYAGQTTAPTAGDDTADGYLVGDLWIDETGDAAYVALDVTGGAAVWARLDNAALHKVDATTAPTTGDDTGDGYGPGSLWIDVTADAAYICLDATTSAAVWTRIDNLTDSEPANIYTETTDPTANDDAANNYGVGSKWVNVNDDTAWICLDASTGAAVWRRIDDGHLPLGKYDATAAPTVDDDTADGYSPGSVWIDTTADRAYVCLDASSGAAVWASITIPDGSIDTDQLTNASVTTAKIANGSVETSKLDGGGIPGASQYYGTDSGSTVGFHDIPGPSITTDTSDPGANDDDGAGYAVGDLWVNTSTPSAWIATDVTTGFASWLQI